MSIASQDSATKMYDHTKLMHIQAMAFLEFAKANETRLWPHFVMAIMTGMRKTELLGLLGLRWTNIDMDSGSASVQRTLEYIKRQAIIMEMKTDRSRRAVALSSMAIEALKYQRRAQAQSKLLAGTMFVETGDWVFTNEFGSPLSQNTIDSVWYRTLNAAGVKRIRFHDLRHTHASLMLQQGVHPKMVSERLGHSHIQITLDTYSHVLPGLQKQAISQLDKALRKAQK